MVDTAEKLPHEDRVKLARMGERILRHAIGAGRRHGRHGPGPHGPRRHHGGEGTFGPPEAGDPPQDQ